MLAREKNPRKRIFFRLDYNIHVQIFSFVPPWSKERAESPRLHLFPKKEGDLPQSFPSDVRIASATYGAEDRTKEKSLCPILLCAEKLSLPLPQSLAERRIRGEKEERVFQDPLVPPVVRRIAAAASPSGAFLSQRSCRRRRRREKKESGETPPYPIRSPFLSR